MAEEPEKKEERDDADAGTLLKTAIDRLDSLHKRMDAFEKKHRDDAEEEEEEEKPEPVAADKKRKRKDSEEEEEEREDSTVFYRGNKAPKRDAKKKDDDDDSRKDDDDDSKRKDDAKGKKIEYRRDEEEEEREDDDSKRDDDDDARRMKKDDDSKKRKDDDDDSKRDDDDDARRKADSDISRRIDRVERMLPKQLSDDERASYSDVQARADEVYHAFGSRAPAPLQGEGLMAYRQRIASKLKEHSSTWKDVNLYAIADDKGFEAVEKTVYADALTVAHSPATAEPGTLRMITNIQGGHEIHTFVGEPAAWMDSLAGPVRMHVTSINTPNSGVR